MDCLRRTQILDAAQRLLCHYGPAKTTVADIAREAGIGVGTVYLEFSSKESIAVELARRHHDAILAAMRAAAQPPEPTPHAERLLHVLRARAEGFLRMRELGVHGVDLLRGRGCAGACEVQRGFQGHERALIEALLRAGGDAGEFHVDDPAALATAVLQAFIAFTAPAIHNLDPGQLPGELIRLHALVLRGLARR